MRHSLSDIGLKYARALVYVFGVCILTDSPYREQLFSLSPLSLSVIIIGVYTALAIWLEVKEIPRVTKKVNITLYVFDTLSICLVISLTGGAGSPIYPFLFLPVIFVSFDQGLKDGLIFSPFVIAMGTLASLSHPIPGFYYFLVSAFTIFVIALTVGFLKDNWERNIEKDKVLSALRALLLQDLTPEETIARAFEILGKAVGADTVVYLKYDEDSKKLKFQGIGYGLEQEEERKLLARDIFLEEGGVSVEVFQTGEPALVEDARTHPSILKDIVENFSVGSAMSFPLSIRGKRWGVFHFVRRGTRRVRFTENDFQKAKELMEETMLVLNTIEQRREVERRRDLLELLTKLISNLARAINIEEIGREMFYILQEAIPNLSDLALLRCRGTEYSVMFYEKEVTLRSPLLREAFQKVMETGRVISLQEETKKEGIVAVPVYEEGRITHIISLFQKPPNPLSEEARMLLSAVAVEVSVALTRVYSLAELEKYAFHDQLTGLLNRRMFYQRMGREIKGARRYGFPLSLAIMDIDDFKEYNDTYGHLEGDRALAELGRLLREEIRASDFAARLGGEEFAIVFPHTSKDLAVLIAERLVKRVKEKIGLSTSIGVGEFPSDGGTFKDLLRKVDEALYEAKKRGKGRIQAVAR